MIIESIIVVCLALGLDLIFGDPMNKYHPTVWIGRLVAKLIPCCKNNSPKKEKLYGTLVVFLVSGIVALTIILIIKGFQFLSLDIFGLLISIGLAGILLKTTIAIKGMNNHAIAVIDFLEQDRIDEARIELSKIVKRNTKKLDKNHVFSGLLETISENTVDGITGPLFYFGTFGLVGAFLYRTINTIDSMIGYKTDFFKNIGWFGAYSDKILNYVPSRLTGFVMVLSSIMLGYNWRSSYYIMIRDCRKPSSLNAGYPMAALAGALGKKLEKVNHYEIGDGNLELSKKHVTSALMLMKVTSILFCGIITIPLIAVLSYLGWWLHA